MKIESVKVDFAVADDISRDNINEMLAEFVASVRNIGFYGIEIEGDVSKQTTTSAARVLYEYLIKVFRERIVARSNGREI